MVTLLSCKLHLLQLELSAMGCRCHSCQQWHFGERLSAGVCRRCLLYLLLQLLGSQLQLKRDGPTAGFLELSGL